MRTWLLIPLLSMMVFSIALSPQVYASPVTVVVAPVSQVVSEYGAVAYTVTVSGPAFPGDPYSLSLSGISGSEALFTPNPVTVPIGPGAVSTLTINVGANGICPGTYSFTVTATHVLAGADSGTSAAFSLTVTPAGPPLQASVTTDKPAYRLNDKVTILMNVNKPALARLTIQPPSGATRVFGPNAVYGATSKTLTADTVGRWSATFEANVCSEFSSAVAYFDVSPDTYDVSLSLSGVPSDVSVGLKVDGNPQGTIGGSEIKKLSFKVETQHSISLDQYVSGQTGYRYFCAQNTWNVGSAGSRTFEYEAQVQLTVTTDPAGVTQVTGDGWYKVGAVAQTSQAPLNLTGSAGTIYVFKGWKIDGALQSGNPVSVTMDKPHTAVATYETRYQLLVDSAYGNPQGAGFYAAGSTATFSVTSPSGFLIQQVFTGWDGDFTGNSPTGSLAMDGPHRVHASWTTSYFQAELLGAVGAAIVVVLLLLKRRRGAGPAMKKLLPSEAEACAQPESDASTTGEMAIVKCSSCGADVPAGEKFCENCGNAMT